MKIEFWQVALVGVAACFILYTRKSDAAAQAQALADDRKRLDDNQRNAEAQLAQGIISVLQGRR